ncbi:hypothetical protein IFM89_026217 [Coptis chinensis]|uniref:FAR1 domain-containing protein n=1 Tax=Coptis chinensis TaxID=261450 RepID=A0A835H930_9MAGN|nr:hypothetical protein IFM89_026217 [Coptis chinensis]
MLKFMRTVIEIVTGVKLVEFSSADKATFYSMLFKTTEEAFAIYNQYAKFVGFSVRKDTYRMRTNGVRVKRRFLCSAAGEQNINSVTPRKRDIKSKESKPITRFKCKARFEVYDFESNLWVVKDFIGEHTHPLVPDPSSMFFRSHRNISEKDLQFATSLVDVGVRKCKAEGTMGSVATQNAVDQGNLDPMIHSTISEQHHGKEVAVQGRQEALPTISAGVVAREHCVVGFVESGIGSVGRAVALHLHDAQTDSIVGAIATMNRDGRFEHRNQERDESITARTSTAATEVLLSPLALDEPDVTKAKETTTPDPQVRVHQDSEEYNLASPNRFRVLKEADFLLQGNWADQVE